MGGPNFDCDDKRFFKIGAVEKLIRVFDVEGIWIDCLISLFSDGSDGSTENTWIDERRRGRGNSGV